MLRGHNNLINEMRKRNEFVTPTVEDSLEKLEKLKKDIDEIIKMIKDENSKPFSSKYTKLLNDNLYNETFRKALLCVVYERVKSIMDKHKDEIPFKYEVNVSNYSINVYIDCGMLLKAFSLDIYEKVPTLESIVYTIDDKKEELEELDSELIELGKKKDDKYVSYTKEMSSFEGMKTNPSNFIRDVKYIDSTDEIDCNEISPIEKQYAVARRIYEEIKIIEDKINDKMEQREKILSLLNVLEQVDFNYFVILRDILEKELGIKVKGSDASILLKHESNTNDIKTYSIGAIKYRFNYTKKTKIPSKGGFNG